MASSLTMTLLRTLSRTRRRRGALAAIVATVLAGGVAACSGNIMASSAQQYYASLPSGWKIFDSAALAHDQSLHSLITTRPKFLEVASANPKRPRASDVLTSSKYPWAIALVRSLSHSEQDQMSFESMPNVLVPLDELSQLGDNIQLLSQPAEQVNGSLHGIVLSVQLQVPTGGTVAYEQSTWVNSATNKVWLLVVGCSPLCFHQQQSVIGSVVSSFLVPNNKGK